MKSKEAMVFEYVFYEPDKIGTDGYMGSDKSKLAQLLREKFAAVWGGEDQNASEGLADLERSLGPLAPPGCTLVRIHFDNDSEIAIVNVEFVVRTRGSYMDLFESKTRSFIFEPRAPIT